MYIGIIRLLALGTSIGRYKHSTPPPHVLVYHTTSAINVCRVNSKKEEEVTKRVWDQLSRANICEAFKTFSPAYMSVCILCTYTFELYQERTRRSSVMVGFDMCCIWRMYKVNCGLWIVSRWWRCGCVSVEFTDGIKPKYRGKMCNLLSEKRNANRPAKSTRRRQH